MNVFQGALLGLIQGLGEFLPISSSGHLLLARLFRRPTRCWIFFCMSER